MQGAGSLLPPAPGVGPAPVLPQLLLPLALLPTLPTLPLLPTAPLIPLTLGAELFFAGTLQAPTLPISLDVLLPPAHLHSLPLLAHLVTLADILTSPCGRQGDRGWGKGGRREGGTSDKSTWRSKS